MIVVKSKFCVYQQANTYKLVLENYVFSPFTHTNLILPTFYLPG